VRINNKYIGISVFVAFLGTVLTATMMIAWIIGGYHAGAAKSFDGGSGSRASPYQISTCGQLQAMSQNLSAQYSLKNNIDCSGTTSWNDGKGFDPIGDDVTSFTGTFDGKGYTVDGLQIIRADDDELTNNSTNPTTDERFVGLFGHTRDATVKNINIANSKIKGYEAVGGVIGYMDGGTLDKATFNLGVSAANSCAPGFCVWARHGLEGGGLVGHLESGTISSSKSAGPVKGSGKIIGGLVGKMQGGLIRDSSSSAAVDGGQNIGGAVGNMSSGTVTRVSATGRVVLNTNDSGISGASSRNDGRSSGDVSAVSSVGGRHYVTLAISGAGPYDTFGGFVGIISGGTISESFANGNVTALGQSIGGFAGTIRNSASITDSYATGDVDAGENSNSSNIGGFVGLLDNGSIVQRAYASGLVSGPGFYGLIGGFVGGMGSSSSISNSFSSGRTSAAFGDAGGFVGESFQGQLIRNFFDISSTGQVECGNGVAEGCTGVSPDGSQPSYFNDQQNAPFTQSGEKIWSDSIWYFDGTHKPVLRFSPPTTPTPAPAVEDNDGVSATIENAAPNSGDGNSDGIKDSEQANVTSFENPETKTYVTLAVDDECDINSVINKAESTNASTDKKYVYLQGLLDYTLSCADPGHTTKTAIYYHDLEKNDAMVVRKYNSKTKQYATISSAQIQGSSPVKVTYSITDGGDLDEDGAANGVIVDPVGLASIDGPGVGAPSTGFEKIMSLNLPVLLSSLGLGVVGGRLIWLRRQQNI